jgi:hypothetical protein
MTAADRWVTAPGPEAQIVPLGNDFALHVFEHLLCAVDDGDRHRELIQHLAELAITGEIGEAAASAEPFLLLPLATLEAAQGAFRPFLPPLEGAGEVQTMCASVVRVLEGMRLLGPPPEASPHPLARLVGPVLTTQRAVQLTGTSRQNLAAQARNRRLVRLASSNRTQWWPTFQFRRAGNRIVANPGVQALWEALPTGTVSDWDHAAWLTTPRDDLDGDAPLDLATDEGALDREPLRRVVDAYVDRLAR